MLLCSLNWNKDFFILVCGIRKIIEEGEKSYEDMRVDYLATR